MPSNPIHDAMTKCLERRGTLDDDDRAAIRALPFVHRQFESSAYLVREGEKPKRCAFMLSGFSYRQKLTSFGARQITGLQVPGEFVDLQNLWLGESDHNIQALTRIEVAEIDIPELRALVAERSAIAIAMWFEALVDAAIFREWIVNIGRRDAHTRVGHLLCEFAVRLETSGIASNQSYDLPMTQEQLGDAVGLTPVHVNRVLKTLAQRGLIERDRRQIRILDWAKLRDASDFNPRYLHTEKASC